MDAESLVRGAYPVFAANPYGGRPELSIVKANIVPNKSMIGFSDDARFYSMSSRVLSRERYLATDSSPCCC